MMMDTLCTVHIVYSGYEFPHTLWVEMEVTCFVVFFLCLNLFIGEAHTSIHACFPFSDFINMFLMKYEEPKDKLAYHCDSFNLPNMTHSKLGCSGQTVFYPHQVHCFSWLCQKGRNINIVMTFIVHAKVQ